MVLETNPETTAAVGVLACSYEWVSDGSGMTIALITFFSSPPIANPLGSSFASLNAP